MNDETRPKAGLESLAGATGGSVHAASDNGTQYALLGADLVVPSTPTDATAGAQQADANTSDWDRGRLTRFITMMAASGVTFTADSCRDALLEADHPNRVGAAFMAASRAGLIVCVGVEPSRTSTRHGGLLRVWRGTGTARGDA